LFDFDGEIEIGEDCFVGPDTRIWSAKKIKIGSRVLIAHNVNIHDNISHPLDANERYNENLQFVNTGIHTKTDIKPAEIIIGDDVWIGFNATIMRGVKIGEGAIIGANTFVKEDIAPWTVNIGNPSRVIRTIESNK
jgi:acetyltransferase-like isoleucine patch superfamily enzyme